MTKFKLSLLTTTLLSVLPVSTTYASYCDDLQKHSQIRVSAKGNLVNCNVTISQLSPAISLTDYPNFSIQNTNLTRNKGVSDGNLIIAENSSLNVENSDLVSKVEQNLIAAEESNITLNNSTLSYSGDATMLSLDGKKLVLNNVQAFSKATGISVENAQVAISNSQITNSNGILVDLDNATTTITNSLLNSTSKTASVGMYTADTAIHLSNIILQVSAPNAIQFLGGDSKITANNSTFNVAGQNSAILYGGNIKLDLIDSNISSASYGVVAVKDAHINKTAHNITLNNSSLTANKALIAYDVFSISEIASGSSVREEYRSSYPVTLNGIEFSSFLDSNYEDEEYLGFDDSYENEELLSLDEVEDDEPTVPLYTKVRFNASNGSVITGGNIRPNQYITTDMLLTDSQWKLAKGSSTINKLQLNNGVVTFDRNSSYQTLTITDRLSGKGNFEINTNLAAKKSDKIVVKGADSGSFGVVVTNRGGVPETALNRLTVITTKDGKANFKLVNSYIDLGAYRYRLYKDNTNWVLANYAPNSPKIILSEKANSQLSLRQAQLLHTEQSLAHINQRLSARTQEGNGSFWLRNLTTRTNTKPLSVAKDTQIADFRQDYYGLQLGSDISIAEGINLGAFIGTARTEIETGSGYNSSGRIQSHSVGLYGSFVTKNRFYWDNVVKYERLKALSSSTGKHYYNAYTLSTEIGKRFDLAQWQITPQLQFSWNMISANNNEKQLSSLYSRAGIKISRDIMLSDIARIQPYVEINGIHTINDSSPIQMSKQQFDIASTKSRVEGALGIELNMNKHAISLEGKRTEGKYLSRPFSAQFNYRYRW
ncbi:hypothetical protein A1D22_05110 [Pasteurellaceae bacterium LFhippo2]|nr:hypothetical protein [Pasteurellaceae bacterium LFhippo2]